MHFWNNPKVTQDGHTTPSLWQAARSKGQPQGQVPGMVDHTSLIETAISGCLRDPINHYQFRAQIQFHTLHITILHSSGSVQECGISSALAMDVPSVLLFLWFYIFARILGTYRISVHDDVIKWKHTTHYWQGIHQSPVNSPNKGQWHGALMFSLICAWINGWVNNREAGDLRRHRAHYDVNVNVMYQLWQHLSNLKSFKEPDRYFFFCKIEISLTERLLNKNFSTPTAELHIDGLVQERRNSTASALELRLSCTEPPMCTQLSQLGTTLVLKIIFQLHIAGNY